MAKSDADSVHEFVEAHRRAGDPRVGEYDQARKAARSAAGRQGAATRAMKAAAKKLPVKRAGRKASTVPVSGTPRFRGGPFAPPPVSAPTVQLPRTTAIPTPRPAPAAPTLAPPVVRAPAAAGRGLTRRQGHAVAAGNQVANRQQANALMGAKPTVTGAAFGGAAGGAATGATLGSVVPGVGTAAGAGVGAALGAAGGAVGGARRKRAYKRAASAAPGARKALVAEFTVCMLVIALSPLTDKHKTDTPAAWMKRMSALMGVFLVLALVSAMGRGGARVAAAFGGLVTVVLAVSERDLFVKVADIFGGVERTQVGQTRPESVAP